MELLQDFYEATLEALKEARNDRLWFKTNTKVSPSHTSQLSLTITPSQLSLLSHPHNYHYYHTLTTITTITPSQLSHPHYYHTLTARQAVL